MHNNNSRLQRASLIFIASTAIIVIGVQPMFIGLLAERLALSLSQQGLVIAMEMGGLVLGTLLSPLLARQGSQRRVYLLSALLALACNLFTAQSASFTPVLAWRLLAGIGGGLLYANALNDLGRLPGQDRSFGLVLFLQTGIFAFSAATLPLVAEAFGSSLAIASMAGWFGLISVSCIALPVCHAVTRGTVLAASGQGSARIGRYSLLGMLFLQLAIYSVWGFLDQLGHDQGLSAVEVGWAFGMGVLGGLPGSGLPSLLGARVSRGPMIGLGSLLVLLAIVLLAGGTPSAICLFVALFILNFGWALALSYYMGAIATNDPQGQFTPLVPITLASAAAVAPAFISMLLQVTGKPSIFITAASAVTIGFLLKCMAGMRERQKAL